MYRSNIHLLSRRHGNNIYEQPSENALEMPGRPHCSTAPHAGTLVNTMGHITQDKCSDKKSFFFVREGGGWCVAYTSGVRAAVCTVGMGSVGGTFKPKPLVFGNLQA